MIPLKSQPNRFVGSITYDNEHLADLEDHMDWWPNLADLDRLNILGAPLEDRARLLASKMSHGLIRP